MLDGLLGALGLGGISRSLEIEARENYPEGWESPKPYIRIVPQPN